MLYAENYDENRKAIVNKNTQEVIFSIIEIEFSNALGVTWLAQNSNVHIDLKNLAKSYERLLENRKDSYVRGLMLSPSNVQSDHKPPYKFNIFFAMGSGYYIIAIILFGVGK